MNAFSALLPTHAMIATAASRSVSPCPAAEPSSVVDPIRKYVVVRDQDNSEHAIVFNRTITHKAIVPAGFTPVSAGFFFIHNHQVRLLENFDSESLHLSPRPQDTQLLNTFLNSSL